jgi:hypothetical protein
MVCVYRRQKALRANNGAASCESGFGIVDGLFRLDRFFGLHRFFRPIRCYDPTKRQPHGDESPKQSCAGFHRILLAIGTCWQNLECPPSF